MTNPEKTQSQQKIITGFRPTSDLTVGNYLGAIKPVIDMQSKTMSRSENELYVFVADLHGLTDNDPRDIAPYRTEVIADARALGMHQNVANMYMQSDIESEVVQIANRIAPYVSAAELSRLPTLKEKMESLRSKGAVDSDDPLRANYALLGYPVLMAADIFAQDTPLVAVGQDQEPHLELTRTIAKRFNQRFGKDILVVPQILALESVKVLSLNGKDKMSKSNPEQAIMFTDDPDHARVKIKKAMTAAPGETNPALDSHFMVAEAFATPDELTQLAEFRERHLGGAQVMGEFKTFWADIMERVLVNFQRNRAALTETDITYYRQVGVNAAQKNARIKLGEIKEVMGF